MPSILRSIVKNISRQKDFINQNIEGDLVTYESSNDGSLSSKDFVKIRKYYGLAVPAILGEAFAALRGYPLTKSERMAATCQGIITGVFDDFFDDAKLPLDYIKRMAEKPESIVPVNSMEKLFIDFYLLALSSSNSSTLIKKYVLQVYTNQLESIEQENSEIKPERIWEITKNKGGNSVLFYRASMDNKFMEREEDTLFQLGSVMQLENDIFDTYKDVQSDIYTIPTTTTDLLSLRDLYDNQIKVFVEMSYTMPFPHKQIVHFLNLIMPVLNRGFVCLDQYEKLQTNNNQVFDVSSFTRKQLICDMESPSNIIKSIYYQVVNNY